MIVHKERLDERLEFAIEILDISLDICKDKVSNVMEVTAEEICEIKDLLLECQDRIKNYKEVEHGRE